MKNFLIKIKLRLKNFFNFIYATFDLVFLYHFYRPLVKGAAFNLFLFYIISKYLFNDYVTIEIIIYYFKFSLKIFCFLCVILFLWSTYIRFEEPSQAFLLGFFIIIMFIPICTFFIFFFLKLFDIFHHFFVKK